MKRILILLALTSCIATIEPEMTTETKADTTEIRKPHKPMPQVPPADTTDKEPIGWNPSVGDWEEINC